ncbi:MAG: PD-(D/E)XK nuclease family protein [Clostridia bacterium]|nr:PD-(D/E)XK nuclease family protein [Clostridia bacterium]
MAATVTFVIGRAGSGKSRYLRYRIAALCDAGQACALIVPEQFTFEAERELSEKLPGGLLNVDVYSFSSLAQRLLEQAGERTAFLCPQGRRMMVRRAVDACRNKLSAFGGVCDASGFCAQCDQMFSLYKRCDLSPGDVKAVADKLPDDPLGRKLRDLSLLYEKSEALLSSQYIRPEDALGAAARHIPTSFLQGQAVLIDNCDIWAEQINGIVEAMMDCAASLTFCIRADTAPGCRDKRVFANEMRACGRLMDMARAHGCGVDTLTLPQKNAPWGEVRYASAAIAHLEHEAFANPFHPFTGETEDITVYVATDVNAEAAAAADAVQRMAAAGYRYRDMAVVACDLPGYAEAVQRALQQRSIPYFTDAKHPLSGYGLPRLLTEALRCVVNGFLQRDVVELAKTMLSGVSREDIEIFENYARRYGVRGNAFLHPFARGDVPDGAERARQALMEPLSALRDALHAAVTTAEKTEALYAYMDALGVREAIEALCETLLNEGRLGLRDENRQVYGIVMELFSQMHAIMGDAPITTQSFLSLFEEGVAAYEAGAIPSTADQLLFGSIDRTRARSVKVLFLLGAMEGTLPQSVRDDGLIDDEELSRLASAGLRTWDDSATHAVTARMDAYLAITKPKEKLYISYCSAEEAVPSPLVDRIREIFPSLRVQTSLGQSDPVDAEGGFMRLSFALRAFADEGVLPDARLYAWYSRDPRYSARLAALEEALYHENTKARLSQSLAGKLYGRNGSASRLETFNACPFKHYARYGLRAQTRQEYGERPVDAGAFCHEALSAFMDRLLRCGADVKSMMREDIEALLDTVLPDIIATHNGGALNDSARARAMGRRLVQRVRATAWALKRQLAAGAFHITGTEVSFGRGGTLPAIILHLADGDYALSGRIDRLDDFAEKDTRYYRVIDYKTGGADFDFADVYYGLKLQLPLYIAAAVALDSAVAAGIYYMPVQDPCVDEGEPLEETLLKALRLRGITLSDERVERATDEEGAGILPPRSGRVDAGVMRRVMAHADKMSRDTASRLLSGDAAALPARRRAGGRTACQYCDYASVCGFDRKLPNSRCNNIESMNDREFMEKTDA